jgi:WhiB family redox-sensing transcriptional regulator
VTATDSVPVARGEAGAGTANDPQPAPVTALQEHWQEQALCAQVDPELFFPEQGAPARNAKRVCGKCDVRDECLAAALAIGADGVWGGTTPRQRQRLGGGVWASATPYLPPPTCGTAAAVQRHRRAGQTCTTCGVGTRTPSPTPAEDEGYPGGPRALARQLGLTVPGAKQLAYEDVENLAAKAYWKNRTVPGPLCGTQRGYDRHLAAGTPTCKACRRAHATVQKANRYRREAAA